MREYRKYATIVALFSAALYVALIVAAFGVISLTTNQDVISEPDAGALLGPIMVTVAVAALLWFILTTVTRSPERLVRLPLGPIGLAGLAAYLGYCVSGGVVYALGSGAPFRSVIFIGGQMASPFALAVAVAGWLVALLYFLVLIARPAGSDRPRWPWERDDD